jgi:hypothetical protein
MHLLGAYIRIQSANGTTTPNIQWLAPSLFVVLLRHRFLREWRSTFVEKPPCLAGTANRQNAFYIDD